jgi:hypothetical protein
MHRIPIEAFNFASATSIARCDENNSDYARVEASIADCDRQAAELKRMDLLTADPQEVEAAVSKLRRQRHVNFKSAIVTMQARLAIVPALEEDRARCEKESALQEQEARRKTSDGLREIGYGYLLASTDHFVKQEVDGFISRAEPVAAALARYSEVRGHKLSLGSLDMETRREIQRLTEQLRKHVQEAAVGAV